jgi:UDP-N-acetylglucosamine 2-epimerase
MPGNKKSSLSPFFKVVTIVGARPQFIKAAAVNRAIAAFNKNGRQIEEILIHTGQHYDYLMDRVFFEELEIPKPHYHLGVGSGSHGKQTGIMLERIEEVLQKEKPGLVLVYGDTNSTLAGALSAAKMHLPVAHVEAGLRSYNRDMPEEINRVLTDHLSTFLFCPTQQAVKNLSKEGIKPSQGKLVENVGDVMYDSILYYSRIAEKKSTILHDLNLANPQSEIRNPQYYLATLHRAENTDDPRRLTSILKALNQLGKEAPVVFPLHPRTRKMMEIFDLFKKNRRIRFIEPVSYFDMLLLEKRARAVLTDSGGVQKEAYWFKVPCFTLREETEWVETVRSGWNRLVGVDVKRIAAGVRHNPRRNPAGEKMFGDGTASKTIVHRLWRAFH